MESRRRFLGRSAPLAALAAAGAPQFAQAPRKTILEMARAAEKLEGVDIIDVHAHIRDTPPDDVWPRTAEVLIEDMNRCGVGLAVFSHIAGLEAMSAAEVESAAVASVEAVRVHPKQLRAYLVFHPHHLETSRRLMRRLLEPGSPFTGFKLHGSFHTYAPDGPNYRPVWEFAHQHKLPVLLHAAGLGRDWVPAVARVADEFPGMKLILAHLGPGEERLPALMKGRTNLFVDTCLSTGRYRQIERIVRAIGPEKVLFATDAAWNSLAGGLGKLAFADLPENEKRLIFGGNARRIFGNRLPAA